MVCMSILEWGRAGAGAHCMEPAGAAGWLQGQVSKQSTLLQHRGIWSMSVKTMLLHWNSLPSRALQTYSCLPAVRATSALQPPYSPILGILVLP